MIKKKILAVIGAGEGALPILKKAKQLDYVTTLAFGQSDSLAKQYADIFVECDIFDIDRIISHYKTYNIDGVIASSESTTEVTAQVANRLGLPGNDISKGFGARDKFVMRKRVSEIKSIKQPRFSLYNDNSDYAFPVVVKATDSCGKRGISIANNKEELVSAVEYAQQYSTDGQVLIEEYLSGGKEYSIECIAGQGYHDVVQFTEKDTAGPPHFIETGHHQPAKLSDEMKDRIRHAVSDVLTVLGINCGLAHLELKIIDDELYFIEVGARGGGDHIADELTSLSTDFDYFKAAIDCCLGCWERKAANSVACSGIYFHCKENAHLAKVFDNAKTSEWCVLDTVKDGDFKDANSNVETSESGYIIYCSSNKIDENNC